jgi:ribonucleotide reductase beta subunit family protein with ferritin-like domain
LRFTLFPLEHHDLFDFYKKSVASFWTAEEVSLAQDKTDWTTKLTENDRHFIEHVLAFFAGSDGIVMENLAANFAKEIQIPEARQFYASQMLIEAVHSEVYSLMIDAVSDPRKAQSLFNAIETVPAVQRKAAWARKWMDPSRRFAERLLAFVCVEGILFSGSFCSIYWLKRRGVMPGLTLSNEFISRDEGLHYSFGCALYKKLRHQLSEETVRAIVSEAVATELEFVTDAIPCRLIGMNAELMQEYIKYVADRAMTDLGYGTLFGVNNPFPWMELISLQGKTNFFEHMPSQYQRAGDREFATNESF